MWTTRDRSNAQEGRCRDFYNAKINPNSGAVNNYVFKSDLRDDLFLYECKCTTKKSISVRKEDIYKLIQQSRLNHKKYIMNLEFQKENPDDTKTDFKNNPEDAFYNLTLIPTDFFVEILDFYKNNYKGSTHG